MKHIYGLIIFCLFCSCSQGETDAGNEEILPRNYSKLLEEAKNEKHLRDLFLKYIRDINNDNWKDKIADYLSNNPDAFIEDHDQFRKAFANYKAEVKHLTIDNNEAIAWLNIKATHVGKYEGLYAGKETSTIEPTGKDLEWQEVWFFDVEGKQFGKKFDFLADDLSRMKQLGIKEVGN